MFNRVYKKNLPAHQNFSFDWLLKNKIIHSPCIAWWNCIMLLIVKQELFKLHKLFLCSKKSDPDEQKTTNPWYSTCCHSQTEWVAFVDFVMDKNQVGINFYLRWKYDTANHRKEPCSKTKTYQYLCIHNRTEFTILNGIAIFHMKIIFIAKNKHQKIWSEIKLL